MGVMGTATQAAADMLVREACNEQRASCASVATCVAYSRNAKLTHTCETKYGAIEQPPGAEKARPTSLLPSLQSSSMTEENIEQPRFLE